MHASKIFGALIVFCIFCGAAKNTLREKFVASIHSMEKKMKMEKNSIKKWEIFQNGRNELIQLRKNAPRQSEMDELDFGDFLDSLAEIPQKYNPKTCENALKQSKTMMASRANPENDSDLVKKSWKIIELLCDK